MPVNVRMPDFFELETFVAVEPPRVYKAWLDAREHASITGGGETTVEPWAGGRFTAFDGYVHGIILALDENRRIVQTWRTADFAPETRDARVTIEFEPARGGTRVRIRQSDTPLDQRSRYEKGWAEHYLKRLAKHFARKRNEAVKPPTAKERATTWGRTGKKARPAKAAAKRLANVRKAPKKKAARRPARSTRKPPKKAARRR